MKISLHDYMRQTGCDAEGGLLMFMYYFETYQCNINLLVYSGDELITTRPLVAGFGDENKGEYTYSFEAEFTGCQPQCEVA